MIEKGSTKGEEVHLLRDGLRKRSKERTFVKGLKKRVDNAINAAPTDSSRAVQSGGFVTDDDLMPWEVAVPTKKQYKTLLKIAYHREAKEINGPKNVTARLAKGFVEQTIESAIEEAKGVGEDSIFYVIGFHRNNGKLTLYPRLAIVKKKTEKLLSQVERASDNVSPQGTVIFLDNYRNR